MEVIHLVDSNNPFIQTTGSDGFETNWSEGLVAFDGNVNQMQKEIILTPVRAPAYYVLAEDGSIHPVLSETDLTLFAPNYDDDEVPPHKLDHMYAKKPREPGMEVSKPARKRIRKKEAPLPASFSDMIDDGPPKINIIRQRHSMNSYGPSRPKILSYTPKPLTFNQSTKPYASSTKFMQSSTPSSPPKIREEVKSKEDFQLPNLTEDFEDFNAPSPGAVVTVCDGVELDPDIGSSRSFIPKSPTKSVQYVSSVPHPSLLDVRNSSLDSIGEPDDESELFFDFHMEEEGNIDVDFSEINPTCSVDMLRDNASSFFQSTCNSVVDVSILLSSDSLEEPDRLKESPSVFTDSEVLNTDFLTESESNIEVEAVKRKRGRPLKSLTEKVRFNDDLLFESSPEPGCSLPVRRSSRPVKLPSRLDDMDEIGMCGKRRR